MCIYMYNIYIYIYSKLSPGLLDHNQLSCENVAKCGKPLQMLQHVAKCAHLNAKVKNMALNVRT